MTQSNPIASTLSAARRHSACWASCRTRRAGTSARRFAIGRRRRWPGRLHRHLFPARGRRGVALAPGRRRRGLALARGRALALTIADDGGRRDGAAGRRPCRRRAPAGGGAGRRLAAGREPRRLDAGRLHGRAGLPVRGLRAGSAGLRAGLSALPACGLPSVAILRHVALARGSTRRVWRFGRFPRGPTRVCSYYLPRSPDSELCMGCNIARAALCM